MMLHPLAESGACRWQGSPSMRSFVHVLRAVWLSGSLHRCGHHVDDERQPGAEAAVAAYISDHRFERLDRMRPPLLLGPFRHPFGIVRDPDRPASGIAFFAAKI